MGVHFPGLRNPVWVSLWASLALLAQARTSLAGLNVWTITAQGAGPFQVDSGSSSTVYGISGLLLSPLKSTDGGQTWNPLGVSSLPPPRPGAVFAFAVNPTNSQFMFLSWFGDLYRSVDGGTTWHFIPASPSGTDFLVVDKGSRVYASTASGVFRSLDGGNSWAVQGNGLAAASMMLFADPSASEVVYAIPTYTAGLFRTSDGGNSWLSLYTGPLSQTEPQTLAIDPTNSLVLYIGTRRNGILKTVDGGVTWNPSNSGPVTSTAVTAIAVDPRAPENVWAGSDAFGIAKSVTGGSCWFSAQDGNPPRGIITGIAVLQTSPSTVVSASQGQIGVLTDAGVIPPAGCPLQLGDGRFSVAVDWTTSTARGTASPVSLTRDTGYFWFFTPNNVELVLKVVDGRAFNGKFWVFYGALSNVEYTITVKDTQAGTTKTYFNPSGQLASVADTAAF
jgi:photosystem II stability/assembly factor-like uncharacterized protein